MTDCCPPGQCERHPNERDDVCKHNELRAENERLRAALEPFALEAERYGHQAMDGDYAGHSAFLVGQLRRARAAQDSGNRT